MPVERRDVPVRGQQEIRHQAQHAGGLLQAAIERRLRRLAQGSRPGRPYHSAEEAAGHRGQGGAGRSLSARLPKFGRAGVLAKRRF